MANVVGEHFFKYTDEQVKERQRIYAKRDRNSDDLAYMNGKTAWLKLVSSIEKYFPSNIPNGEYHNMIIWGSNIA